MDASDAPSNPAEQDLNHEQWAEEETRIESRTADQEEQPRAASSSVEATADLPLVSVDNVTTPMNAQPAGAPKSTFQSQPQQAAFPGRRLSSLDVSTSLEGVALLARQGSWRALVEKVGEGYKFAGLSQQLAFRAYHVLALLKLRQYGAAEEELAQLGDLDEGHYDYGAHPGLYPGREGSMVPFALRWLHALLPHFNGHAATTVDRLYALLEYCDAKISALHSHMDGPSGQSPSPPSAPEPAAPSAAPLEVPSGVTALDAQGMDACDDVFLTTPSAADSQAHSASSMWLRRHSMIGHTLLSHHVALREYPVALQWFRRLLEEYHHARHPPAGSSVDHPTSHFVDHPSSAGGSYYLRLLSLLGRLLLQMGDVAGAKAAFAMVEKEAEKEVEGRQAGEEGRSVDSDGAGGEETPNRSSSMLLLLHNRALLLFGQKSYSMAGEVYGKILEVDPTDAVACNNKSLCLMYCRNLVGSVKTLESALQSTPLTAVNEALVLNLSSMYELATVNTGSAKQSLSNWLNRIAPDDFDVQACAKL